jgi:hypothetical protein
MARHYIAYLNGKASVCSTREGAANLLADYISRDARGALLLHLQYSPADCDHAEIIACDCNDPTQHCRDGE